MFKNAKFTFNKKFCEEALKPSLSSRLGREVCFHFQRKENYTYPSVIVRYLKQFEYDELKRKHFNLIELTFMNNDNDDYSITEMIDEFYKTSKLNRSKKKNNFTNIRLYNYENNEQDPEELKNCMELRIYSGFRNIDDNNDYQICTSQCIITTHF